MLRRWHRRTNTKYGLTVHDVVGASVSQTPPLPKAAVVGLDEPPYSELPSPIVVGVTVVVVGEAAGPVATGDNVGANENVLPRVSSAVAGLLE